MKKQDNEKLSKLYRKLDKNLREKEDPESTASKELIEQLPELNFKTTVSSGYLMDALANNGNKHTQQAAYKKFSNEDKIFVAACFGWKKTVTKLRLKNADVNASLPSGQTLLYLAAQYGKSAMVALLLDLGADVNCQTVLHEIIQDDNYEALEAQMGSDIAVNPFVTSPLCAATNAKHYEVMEQLLKHKAKVDQRSLYGKLLDSGTKTNELNAHKCVGCVQGHNPSYEEEESYTYSAMHIAAKNDDTTALALLVKYGADVNQSGRQDKYSSSTPLHVAIKSGSVNAVEYLIKNNADVNRRAHDFIVSKRNSKAVEIGLTPLHLAAELGNTAVISLLLEKGAIIENWDAVLDAVISNEAHIRKQRSSVPDTASNQIELLKRLLERQDKPEFNYAALFEMALKPSRDNHFTVNYAVADVLLSYTNNWSPVLKTVIAKNDLQQFKTLLERKDRPSINFDKYLSLALKPTYENKHKPDVRIIELLLAEGAAVTDEQIAQTQKNGLDYLVEPLTAAKKEQDKALKQKPAAVEDATPAKVGFFKRVFGSCGGGRSASEQHRPH